MKAHFYLSSGQTVTVEAEGEFTIKRSAFGCFAGLDWEGDLVGPVPAIWPSSEEVVMLTLD